MANDFWTTGRTERLLLWYGRFKYKRDRYNRIAKKLKTTRSAVYHKLGRMGKVEADWTKGVKV